MTYATTSDLETACGGVARLTQLADWNNDRTPDSDRMVGALASADAMINSYLAKQRLVPLAQPYPQSVVECAARIARYRLASARGMLTDDIRTDMEADTLWLKDIAEGKAKLDVDPQPTAASDRIDASLPRPSTKDVSRKKLHGFS